jgi:hypothetical protein
MDVDELQHALGGIVLEAAYLERVLRTAFSALVGSKYATVIDGRLTAATLIEDCEQIARHHTGIGEPARVTLLAALQTCREVNRERNRMIHDTWATRPGNVLVTLHGGQKSHDVMVTARTLSEVRQVAEHVAGAAHDLGSAMATALGPGWVHVENELRQEPGRARSADPTS